MQTFTYNLNIMFGKKGFFISMEMANLISTHKKESKQLSKNYRPISLLQICAKILERLIYNKMYYYLIDNNLISLNQSGFKQGDSCINQLLSITHGIHNPFDETFEAHKVF